MREIKFRAWYMPFGSGGPMQEMVHGKASKILAFSEMSPDDYIVEQYTGVKDVNLVDVYAGDIVEVFRGSLNTVVFREGCFGLETKDDPLFVPLCNLEGSMKVIGNIHENPELLEE
ncbi:YopX family protein [Lentilactobacillus sp. SPB1-3]|uniref:YopX family protein n=1 Tax=Lentilactobacillus terminaliae TaxID=3003483 RepID=A0ACD5DD00_9LACO|nr:YopX family protein [Lentilactobacillus sp. SPB1-3]MCZ0978019.1 YopX family protein [Lentilactobacillus sp. SPB1-3]